MVSSVGSPCFPGRLPVQNGGVDVIPALRVPHTPPATEGSPRGDAPPVAEVGRPLSPPDGETRHATGETDGVRRPVHVL